MALTQKAIETISVNAVRNSIVTSPLLDQFIADNDKEPSWDGNVYIYEDKSKKKSKLIGRMPVQIKGKLYSDFSQNEISYSMEVSDLRNYLHDGGIILFVVYVNSSGTATQIYYNELTPVKLRFELNKIKTKKTKTIKLKKFPDDGDKKANIFLNCFHNCHRQASFSDSKLYSIEELEKTGLLESISMPIFGTGTFDTQTLLMTNETYLYANIKGSSIPQPVELLLRDIVMKEEISNDVVIDGYIHYNKYNIIRKTENTTFLFGESFMITFEGTKSLCKINYKNSPKLRVLAKDLHFLLDYIDKGYFQVGNIKFPFNESELDFSNFDIEKEKQRLLFAQRSVKVLDILGCKEDINLTKLTEGDISNLIILALALIDKKTVSVQNPNLSNVISLTIAGFKFALILEKDEKEGKYSIFDFFRRGNVTYKDANGKTLPISQYEILHADNLLEIKNILPEQFLPSFQEIQTEDKYTRANFFLLELLKAYDKSNDQRQDLLKVADDFSKWLYEAPEQYLDHNIKCINRYQAIKRERNLKIEEVSELWNIVKDNFATDDCKLGAYLLLDQQIPAMLYYEKMDETARNNFRTYPIFRYYKATGLNNGRKNTNGK